MQDSANYDAARDAIGKTDTQCITILAECICAAQQETLAQPELGAQICGKAYLGFGFFDVGHRDGHDIQ
jgi:hypothetical protein